MDPNALGLTQLVPQGANRQQILLWKACNDPIVAAETKALGCSYPVGRVVMVEISYEVQTTEGTVENAARTPQSPYLDTDQMYLQGEIVYGVGKGMSTVVFDVLRSTRLTIPTVDFAIYLTYSTSGSTIFEQKPPNPDLLVSVFAAVGARGSGRQTPVRKTMICEMLETGLMEAPLIIPKNALSVTLVSDRLTDYSDLSFQQWTAPFFSAVGLAETPGGIGTESNSIPIVDGAQGFSIVNSNAGQDENAVRAVFNLAL